MRLPLGGVDLPPRSAAGVGRFAEVLAEDLAADLAVARQLAGRWLQAGKRPEEERRELEFGL